MLHGGQVGLEQLSSNVDCCGLPVRDLAIRCQIAGRRSVCKSGRCPGDSC